MTERYPSNRRAADTSALPDIDALRRQLDQIELLGQNSAAGKNLLAEFQKKADALQKETEENQTNTAIELLRKYDHVHAIEKRKEEITGIIKSLQEAESVDLCFMMDCTNSMKKYIDQVKNYIFTTVEMLTVHFPNLNMRLAFVGYRDLNLPQDQQYSIIDFTNTKEFNEFVSTVQCAYGGDFCEDVLGGLQKTTQLNWKQPVRILIHVGDAPAHGRLYHDLGNKGDAYFESDQDGSIGCSHILELIELKVKYFFGRLNAYTDKMIEKFRSYTENKMTIEEVDLEKYENLLPFIVESVTRSISETTSSFSKSGIVNDKKTYRNDINFDKVEPDWSTIDSKIVKVVKFDCNEQLQVNEINQRWNIKIAANPFDEGSLRLAYYGSMLYKDTWEKVVLKEYKCINRGANIKKKYLEALDCQTVAEYLAAKFNTLPKLKDLTNCVKKIKFILVKLIFEPIGPHQYRNMTMEKFIEGTYKKYSNNAGFVDLNDPSYTLQAFSHWTHEHTNGNIMVIDLQGIVTGKDDMYLLTDPCIHSTDYLRFGRTNLGKPGMKRFFETHVCNIICHALNLMKNEHQPDITAAALKYDKYFVSKSNRTMFV